MNDKCHRNNGLVAAIWYDESGKIEKEYYCLNGKFHREDGPAEIVYNKNGKVKEECYYLNGIEITNPSEIKEINSKFMQKESKNIKQTKKRKIFIIEDF